MDVAREDNRNMVRRFFKGDDTFSCMKSMKELRIKIGALVRTRY